MFASFFLEQQLLALAAYEDKSKYAAYEPKLTKYRADLAANVLSEYLIKVPSTAEEREKSQFNAVQYLYAEKLLSPEEFVITDSSIGALLENIASGKWLSVQVFKAFAKRATIAHQLLNCALELFPKEGLERAETLDQYLKENGRTIGPLHGLPVSLKEQMNFKGKITHGGYVSKIDNVPSAHGASVQVLENLGCVFYIRTTQPQTLMHLDSNNNFIGLAKNPYNSALTPGGSSSGEGAVVGFGGLALGIGSDIGGSIRGPAAFSGCVGLRPTLFRFSKSGGVSSGAGQESVPAVQGPLARSVQDIELLMDAFVNKGRPWEIDATCVPMAWRKVPVPEPKKLTVAVVYDDLIVKPTPPILRGLKHTVEKLKAAGVKVVEFTPIEAALAKETVLKMYNCDGNFKQRELLASSGEPLMHLTKWALNYGDGETVYEVKDNRVLNATRDDLRQKWTDYMVQNKVDVILLPVYNNVAPQHETAYNWSYTLIYNILDFPSLTVQTGLFQDPKVDTWTAPTPRNKVEELEHSLYDPLKFVGAPIAVQLAGRRYFDEDVVAAGRLVERILGVDLFKH